MLRKEHEKLEEISRQMLWAIELIPEAKELKLDKRLSLVEIESEFEDEKDRGIFNILLDGEVKLFKRKLYTEYSAHSVMALLEVLNSLLKGKKEFKLFKVDGDVAYDLETQTQHSSSAHSVMALLEVLNSLLKGKKEFKLFKVDGDVAYDLETQTQHSRHDACNIVFVDEYEPVEDYDFQQAILKASGYKLGVCHYELSGGIFSSVYVECGIAEVEDVEGDLYVIHEREEAKEEDYAKANKVLEAWIAKGFEI